MSMACRWMAISALLLVASPRLAAGQATTAFDGMYNGVTTTSNNATKSCIASARPGALTITNGAAVWRGDGSVTYQGNITQQGMLMMRSGLGGIINAKIEAGGKLKGSMVHGSCVITHVWQKK